MASKSVTLTEVGTGNIIYVSAANILNFYADTSDAVVTFIKNNGESQTITANETVATVNTAAARTQALTDTATGTVIYLNSDRIIYLKDNGNGTDVIYNAEGQFPVKYVVDEAVADINIAALNTFIVPVFTGNGTATENVYINNLYVGSIEAASASTCKVTYQDFGLTPFNTLSVDDTAANIAADINAL